jgi:hypothetical protein
MADLLQFGSRMFLQGSCGKHLALSLALLGGSRIFKRWEGGRSSGHWEHTVKGDCETPVLLLSLPSHQMNFPGCPGNSELQH